MIKKRLKMKYESHQIYIKLIIVGVWYSFLTYPNNSYTLRDDLYLFVYNIKYLEYIEYVTIMIITTIYLHIDGFTF